MKRLEVVFLCHTRVFCGKENNSTTYEEKVLKESVFPFNDDGYLQRVQIFQGMVTVKLLTCIY